MAATAKRSGKRSGTSLRYYICGESDLQWRLPNRLHAEMVAGTLEVPQFANTRQRVLEVVVPHTGDYPVLFEARGVVYTFSGDGRLDTTKFTEPIGHLLTPMRNHDNNVINVTGLLRGRMWRNQETWDPSPVLLNELRADLEGRRSKARLLKRPPD